MAAVLLMVGQDQEDPDIVASLLDLSAWPQKPQYAMAAEVDFCYDGAQRISILVTAMMMSKMWLSQCFSMTGASSALCMWLPQPEVPED